MATFKVGQRVKIVNRMRPEHRQLNPAKAIGLGCEATIIATTHPWPDLGDCLVSIDGVPAEHPCGGYLAYFYQLAPLTDPLAEQFIERIKRLEREPAPMKKETA